MPTPTPLNVFLFRNGMVIAYDESGTEIDEFRGMRDVTWPKIQPHLGPYSIVQGSTFGRKPPPTNPFNLPEDGPGVLQGQE